MALQWQKVEIPLTGPLNEKGKPEALPNGSLTVSTNAIQARDGSIGKRKGHSLLAGTITGGGAISFGQTAMFGFRDAPCVIDGHWVYSYSPTDASWRQASRVPECGLTKLQTFGVAQQPDFYDMVYCNGYYVLAECSSGVIYTVIDAATGVRVSPAFASGIAQDPFIWSGGLATVTVCRLCVVGNKVVFVYWDTSTAANLKFTTLDCTSAATIAAGTAALANIATNVAVVAGFGIFDCDGGATRFYVTWRNTAGAGTPVTVTSFNTAGVAQTTTNLPATAPNSVAVGADETDRVWVANDDGTTAIHVVGLSPANLAVTLSTDLAVITTATATWGALGIIGKGAGSGHLVGYDNFNGRVQWRKFSTVAGAVSTAGTTTRTAFNTLLVSRQALVGGRIYVTVTTNDILNGYSVDPPQNVSQVVDITDDATDQQTTMRPVGTLSPGLCQPTLYLGGSGMGLTHWAKVGATKLLVPQLIQKSGNGVGVNALSTKGGTSSLDTFVLDFAATNQWQAASLGESLGLAGGCPSYFDGKSAAEIGFVTWPQKPGVAGPQAFVGGLTVGTSYTWKAIYEAADATGCVHWSAPSAPSNAIVPTAGNTQATITVLAPQIYARPDLTMRVTLYRAKGNNVFRRIATQIASAGLAPGTVSFIDTTTDTVGDTGAPLYTEGGALPRMRPPPLSPFITHQDRWVGVDETQKNVWFSGQYTYGEAPWFSSLFQFPVDVGGPITGLASMEGRLYIFKRDRLFYVIGDGPADNGAGAYALPAPIPTQVGCIEPRSIVVTPQGIFFQSDQGIYLLTRKHEVVFIGAGIEQSLLNLYPTITSAVLNEADGRVIFTATGGGQGVRFEYDLVHDSWSIVDIAGETGFFCAAVIGGTLTTGRPLWYGISLVGDIHVQNLANYLDPGSAWQTTRIQTGWIKIDGQQSNTRIRNVTLLSERMTGHDLTITLAYDYGAVVDTRIFTAAQIAALTTTREQITVDCTIQKVEAIQVTISDASPSSGTVGTGQGANFMGLAFEIGRKRGVYRRPAANTQ